MWRAHALTPNLPFCEEPYALSPYLAQAGSCLAHAPYVPLVLLGVSSFSPSALPGLDARRSPDAGGARRLLVLQAAIQAFTALGGHALPNPRAVANQEVSIFLTYIFLLLLFTHLTPSGRNEVTAGAALLLCAAPVAFYAAAGLLPTIFSTFLGVLLLGCAVPGAFGRLTPRATSLLVATFLAAGALLVLETLSCDFLQGIARDVPYHLAFDIAFWQVVGGALDVVLVTPAGPLVAKR
ncbi:hypothetical protein TeGR_g11657 [Tetraparma gracilis]|uniref:Uncharacterized protein n=1 Tax=Tetraparma gracilis TaxID=2962635 RepID=A0ABQ6MZ22_9STRA|nr:hypothetical protein TeGR_g11657 [Tetraparma gracilis]